MGVIISVTILNYLDTISHLTGYDLVNCKTARQARQATQGDL